MRYTLSFIKVLSNEFVQYDTIALNEFYIDYFNNFLTIDRFSEYHNFTRYEASRILDLGKEINHNENLKELYELTINKDY